MFIITTDSEFKRDFSIIQIIQLGDMEFEIHYYVFFGLFVLNLLVYFRNVLFGNW